MGWLGEFAELCLDGVEVRKVAGIVARLGVLDDAFFVDDEGRTLGDSAHGQVLLGVERVVGNVVVLGHVVLVVAEHGEIDAFFLGPSGLGERVVSADTDDRGLEAFVGFEALSDGAEFVGADAGEGHRDEEQEDV